jgi:quercetin dioxygenase-like cupin family protein
MISYGHIDLEITQEDLDLLPFSDYFACYRQYDFLEKYYTEHNSSVWQLFEDSPEWVHNLGHKVPSDHQHHVVSVVKIDPGQTVPNHLDKHFKVKEEFGDGETARYLIFLQDWKRGHYFEIQDQPYVKWKQGDWIKFGPNDWHLAGNMGDEPFYTAQVTVLYK